MLLICVVINRYFKKYTTTSNLNDSEGREVDDISPISSKFYSSNIVRTPIVPDKIYDKWPVVNSLPKILEMDYSRILAKPFLVRSIPWPSSIPAFQSINTDTLFPSQILTNSLITIPFQASTLFRCKACFMVQVSGTSMHQGTLLASVLPAYTPIGTIATTTNTRQFVNTMMAAPHAFLHANNSTSACIEIPFMYNNKLCYCDPTGNVVQAIATGTDFAQLSIVVINPLQGPASSSVALNVVVHVIFEELEFYSPHVDVSYRATPEVKLLDPLFNGLRKSAVDILDSGINFVRSYTGLHNVNKPMIDHKVYNVGRNDVNNADQPTKLEKLDPFGSFDRKVNDYVFGTDQDEMDMRFLFKKPYYLASFGVSTTTPLGAVLMTRPITPFMESVVVSGVNYLTFPLSMFHRLSRFWRGTLKLHIQSNMTAFHFCKLVIARNYSPVSTALTQYPNFLDVQNLLTETIEFSGGGMVHTIDLPFVSPYNQLECSQSPVINAMQHGLFHIFLAQDLVVNGTVPQSISFNVYLSAGDDFCFYGYPTVGLEPVNVPQLFPKAITLLEEVLNLIELESDRDNEDCLVKIGGDCFKTNYVAKKESGESVIPMQVPMQDELLIDKNETKIVDDNEFRPLISIRDFGRRFYQHQVYDILGSVLNDPVNRSVVIPVSSIIGFDPRFTTPVSPLQFFARLFYGFVGGIKFKFRINGVSNATVKFIPPGIAPNIFTNLMSAATPYPPTANIASAQIVDYVASNLQALPFNAAGSFPTVGIEAANYVHNQSYNTSSYGAESYSSSEVIVEGMVPYMNQLSFVGDTTRFYIQNGAISYTSRDLGHLVVSFVPVANPDGTSVSNVLITPFYGLSDESRFGYNVLSFPVSCPAYTSAPAYLLSPYNNGAPGSVRGAPLADPLTDSGAAYFTKPV